MEKLKLYCKSMGKIFRVKKIAKTEDEANLYCEKHRDCAVIAEDRADRLIFIAEIYAVKGMSCDLPD